MVLPRIVTAGQIGLRFTNRFGELGPETNLTGHYTAGPVDRDDQHAIELCRQYHAAHAAKGWGGIGYHYCITRKGTILGLRPTLLKGTHTALHNTQNAGVMFLGTTGDQPTGAQARSYRWLLRNAHTTAMPVAHRTDLPLSNAKRRGHKEWPDNHTACPGDFLHLIKTRHRARSAHA